MLDSNLERQLGNDLEKNLLAFIKLNSILSDVTLHAIWGDNVFMPPTISALARLTSEEEMRAIALHFIQPE